MKNRFDLKMTHVPYRSTPQSIQDIAAGHVQLGFAEAGASLPLIRDGKLRALAVSSSQRLPQLPDVAAFRRSRARARLRSGVMAHAVRAAQHAEGDRRQASRRDEEDHGRPGHEEKASPTSACCRSTRRRSRRPRPISSREREKWGELVRDLGLEGTQ